MMRKVICWNANVILLMLLAVLTGCNGLGGTGKMPLLFETDFENGSFADWPTPP